jgi:hypothetical protein
MGQAAGPRWGVLLVSYDKTKESLLKATVTKLKDDYGFAEDAFATAFDPKRQVIELYCGSFADRGDPALAELLEKVVNIQDWQKSDPQPFKGAQIRSFVYGK